MHEGLTHTDYAADADVSITPPVGRGNGSISVGAKSRVKLRRLSFIGADHRIEIGSDALIRSAALAVRGTAHRIRIGDRFTCRGSIINAYGADITIGDDVLFSSNISIRTHDMHHIIDVATGAPINPAAPIVIEDHVWFGEGVKIMPGVRIGRDSVVGIGTIVTRDVPPGCVFAGVPGRVLREGVTWRK